MTIAPLESKDDLFPFFEKGEKRSGALKIGTEHEVFLFDEKTLERANASQISDLLESWGQREGKPLYEKGTAIGLDKGEASLSLEPGGQFELSGAPLENLHETAAEIRHHQHLLSTLAQKHHLQPFAMGADPITPLAQRNWMAKARYDIMRPYMATKGAHGHEMMTGTCTVQVNLDYTSEKDMIQKMRVGMALQPLVTALFADSPLSKGQFNGYQSIRRAFWNQTDPDRCGMLPFVFEDNMGYERYIDYALDVPMYFIRRQGRYLNVAGIPFRTFLEGRLEVLPHEKPTMEDWADHLTTLFPEVRLKQFIEMRGADSGPFSRLMALPSFWVGLLYDSQVLEDVYNVTQTWTTQEILKLSQSVAQQGLEASFLKHSLRDIAHKILLQARQGLIRRKLGEEDYLDPLFHMLESGKSFADQSLESFKKQADPHTFIKKFSTSSR